MSRLEDAAWHEYAAFGGTPVWNGVVRLWDHARNRYYEDVRTSVDVGRKPDVHPIRHRRLIEADLALVPEPEPGKEDDTLPHRIWSWLRRHGVAPVPVIAAGVHAEPRAVTRVLEKDERFTVRCRVQRSKYYGIAYAKAE